MSDNEQAHTTLAAFTVDTSDGAKRLLKAVQRVDEANDNVKIVDAAIVDRGRFGRISVHQTDDRGALKTGVRVGTLGVIAGAIVAGPAGAVAMGAAGGILGGLRGGIHDTGIDDKFMRSGWQGDREEEERPVRPLRGQLGALDRAHRAGDHRRARRAVQQHADGREGRGADGPRGPCRRGTWWRRGRRRLRARDRRGASGGRAGRGGPRARGGSGRRRGRRARRGQGRRSDAAGGRRAQGVRGPPPGSRPSRRWPSRTSRSCGARCTMPTWRLPPTSGRGPCRPAWPPRATGRA